MISSEVENYVRGVCAVESWVRDESIIHVRYAHDGERVVYLLVLGAILENFSAAKLCRSFLIAIEKCEFQTVFSRSQRL